MEKEFIITSTNSIEGGEIVKYFGVINNNLVVGTNIFSDIGASFSDFFGGSSKTYQNKLKGIYDSSIENLKLKARNLGANAIIGLSIDFDEISGGNKSMFMISVSGTAVNINYNFKSNKNLTTDDKKSVSRELLESEITKKIIETKVNNGKLLSQEEWFFIQQNPINGISEKLIDTYLKVYDSSVPKNSENGKVFHNNIKNYYRVIDRETSIDLLYDRIKENSILTLEILTSCNLFSADKIIELINENHIDTAIDCLIIEKDNFSMDDLDKMEEILQLFDNLEDKGEIKKSKGLLGKEKEKYICPKGHSNSSDVIFCYECNQNIKGFLEKQVNKIEDFRLKAKTLREIFETN